MVRRIRERGADRRSSRVDLAPREAEQRDPRLRLVPKPVGLLERLLGAVEVTAAHPHLAHFVRARPRLREPPEPLQLRLRLPGLVFGLRIRASEPHDLGPLHPADAREAGDRLALAPARGRLGPLRRPPVVGDAPAHPDRDAVDVPGGVRREFTADGRQGRLVHERESLLELCVHHEDRALQRPPERHEVPVPEPRTDLLGRERVLLSLLDLAPLERRTDEAELEPSLLDALRFVRQQPRRALQPAVPHRRIQPVGVLHREPETHTGGLPFPPLGGERCVGALECVDALVRMRAPPRRLSQAHEVLARQARIVERDEALVRLLPRVRVERLPGTFQGR